MVELVYDFFYTGFKGFEIKYHSFGWPSTVSREAFEADFDVPSVAVEVLALTFVVWKAVCGVEMAFNSKNHFFYSL